MRIVRLMTKKKKKKKKIAVALRSSYESQHQKTCLRTCALRENLDQPVLSRSLLRIVARCVSTAKDARFSSCADAQTD